MLRGEMTGLRARHDSDIPVLHAELYNDVATRVRADSRPWQPIPPGSGSPYVATGPDDHAACFSVVELATGELAGEALLWNIDLHNRAAHRHLAATGIPRPRAGRERRPGSLPLRVRNPRPAPAAGRRPLLITTRSSRPPAGRVHARRRPPALGVGQRRLRQQGHPRPAGNRMEGQLTETGARILHLLPAQADCEAAPSERRSAPTRARLATRDDDPA